MSGPFRWAAAKAGTAANVVLLIAAGLTSAGDGPSSPRSAEHREAGRPRKRTVVS